MSETRRQMSDSLLVGILLTLGGGFLDAYTYLMRGEVFANAQTGNIVLLGIHLMRGEWMQTVYYLIPILSFVAGVWLVHVIRGRMERRTNGLHWRQGVILLELVLIAIVGFLPQSCNMLANLLVSFTCAMQVEGFRRVHDVTCATTMCTGNLRSATELLWKYRQTGDPEMKRRSLYYYGIDVIFVVGAMAGVVAVRFLAQHAAFFVCALQGAAFAVMFIQEDIFGPIDG